jgi:hypothetical protein
LEPLARFVTGGAGARPDHPIKRHFATAAVRKDHSITSSARSDHR